MRKLGGVLAVLILGLVGGSLTTPAQAAGSLYIANSTASRGPIVVYSSYWPQGYVLCTGCERIFSDSDNSVRIDPEQSGQPDVGSTWWGFIGEGYDYCDPGEGQINPPTSPANLRYNTDASDC